MSYLNIRRVLQKVVGGTTQPLTLGGIQQDGSDAKITIGTNGIIDFPGGLYATNAASGTKTSQVATTAFSNSLITEYTVSGSASNTITISGLNIATEKAYILEMELINGTANEVDVYCTFNGLNTVTDYYRQTAIVTGTAAGGTRANNPQIAIIKASEIGASHSVIQITNGYPTVITRCIKGFGSSTMELFNSVMSKTTALSPANITSITISSPTSGAFAIGSKIRLYRSDV